MDGGEKCYVVLYVSIIDLGEGHATGYRSHVIECGGVCYSSHDCGGVCYSSHDCGGVCVQ